MPSLPSRPLAPRRYGYLIPFGLLAAYGLLVLIGWWSGNAVLVQPRSYDAPLPANAAACFLLLGLTPILLGLRWNKTGLALGFLVSGLALATMLQDPLGLDFGLDQRLVRHEAIVAGASVARMPMVLAGVCTVSALLVVWLAVRPRDQRLTVVLGLAGSLILAYALTGLLAYRNGLNLVTAWQTYARVGPHTAPRPAAAGRGADRAGRPPVGRRRLRRTALALAAGHGLRGDDHLHLLDQPARARARLYAQHHAAHDGLCRRTVQRRGRGPRQGPGAAREAHHHARAPRVGARRRALHAGLRRLPVGRPARPHAA
ncbi:MAG: hypothetical protein WDM96_07405 [Lacunisphaera sp.]